MALNMPTGSTNAAEVLSDVYEEAPAAFDRVVEYRSLRWNVLKGVFAPYPAFKGQAPVTPKNICMFEGKRVLDLGSGSGVRAVIAGMAGAAEVVATDISYTACLNTVINARRYDQDIQVLCTSMFDSLATRFDTIVSYLPSRDAPVTSPEERATHDPDFELNFKLIAEAADFLRRGGSLHTAFLDQGQISECNTRIARVGYEVTDHAVRPHETGDWHFYSLTKP